MNLKNVQDFYPLTPMQQGMLFHTLSAPESGVYVEQLSCRLNGELDVAAFERAWQRTVERHTVLRTAFVTAGLKEPVQVVHRQVKLPFHQEDWRTLNEADLSSRLEAFVKAERQRGFDPAAAPLLRIALLRLADDGYRFVLTYHHLLLDGWSFAALIQEVFAQYEALAGGKDLKLPAPRPFRDYLSWLKKQDAARAEAFWRETLKGMTAPTPIVMGHPPAEPPPDGNPYPFHALHLSEEETQQLQNFARRNHLTINTLIQGAWALLLSRYSNEETVVFGATVSGRPADLPGAESMIGLFINTLPVRVTVDPRANVVEWLKQLQAQQAELRLYEYSPLVQIQGWSDVPRGLPLFESIVVFENYPIEAAVREGTGGISLAIDNVRTAESTNYPLTVAVSPGKELSIELGYDGEKFAADAIVRLLGHLRTLLREMTSDAARALLSIPHLTAEESRLLLVEWNRTDAELPSDSCIHQLFEEAARKFSSRTAVKFDGRQLTYQELNERANRLAHHLRRQGIGPDMLVAICIERSLEMVIGVLGIIKAGGAYVPLDPRYPQDRLLYMLKDSGATVLLTQQSLLSTLPASNAQVLCLDGDWNRIATESSENPPILTNLENLIYAIYTSGTTGKPKGVLIGHRSVVNMAYCFSRALALRPEESVLQFASLSFDASVMEIFPTLLGGATLCLAQRVDLMAPDELSRILEKDGVTVAFLPPALLRILDPDRFPTLKTIITGGESSSREVVTRWARGRRFVNAYGPTETTVGPTLYPVEGDLPREEIVPIGKAIANAKIYLLDRNLQPVPVGIPGEIHVGGVGLARGYLNQPELTAEKFIDWEYEDARVLPSSLKCRLYRTGDLARYLPDGNIEYLGRLDHQVKIRGFRIELEEIETSIEQHPSVRQAVVTVREDQPGQKRLIAYVSLNDPSLDLGQLRSSLHQHLPEYMVPAVFVALDSIPLNANGKVDRRRLPAPEGSRPESARDFVPPRDLLEAQVAAIWEEVLEIRPIGVTDNFYDLGGHSLLAVRIIGLLQQRMGVNVPLVRMIEEPTVEHLARVVRPSGAEMDNSALVKLMTGSPDRQPFFLIHPSGGSVHWYFKLAHALGADQPVYGIQARGVNGDEEIQTEIEEMASYYIESMKTVQSHGPYLLGSWSMGVVFVFEMAQQLMASGEKVGLLAILDQGPMPPGVNPAHDAEYLYYVFGKHIPISLDRLRELSPEAQVRYVMEVARQNQWIHPDMTDALFINFVRMLKVHTQAWWNYEPKPYPGRITYFRALEQPADIRPGSGIEWESLAPGRVEIIEVPGDHLSMMDDPHVRILAEKLRQCLDLAHGLEYLAKNGD